MLTFTIELPKGGQYCTIFVPFSFGIRRLDPQCVTMWNPNGGHPGASPLMDPLSPARIRHGLENPLTLLKNVWDEKIRRFRRVLHASATAVQLLPKPISALRGWHSDAHHAMGTIAVNIASRSSFHCSRNVVSAKYLCHFVKSNPLMRGRQGHDRGILPLRAVMVPFNRQSRRYFSSGYIVRVHHWVCSQIEQLRLVFITPSD